MKITRKIIALLLSVLMVVFMVPLNGTVLEASAADAVDVLVWSPTALCSSGEVDVVNNLIQSLRRQSISYSSVLGTNTLSKIGLTNIKLLVVFWPHEAINSSDMALLKSYVSGGGHLMLIGEYLEFSRDHGNMNDNICAIGKTLKFNFKVSQTSQVLEKTFTVSISSNSSLLKNVKQLTFSAAATISDTDGATEIVSCNNNVCLIGKRINKGYVTFVPDGNFFGYSTNEDVDNFLLNCCSISETTQSEIIKPEWFEKGAYSGYNHELAQFCADLVLLGYGYNEATVTEGLEEVGLSVESIDMEAARDEVNYFIADKNIKINGTDKNLIVIGCIGSYKNQWYSNFDPLGYARENPYADNSEKNVNHIGFADARDYVYGKLNEYIREKNIDKSNSIILLTGHSRGSATVNLLGAKLIDSSSSFGVSTDNIYTYGFATPNTTTKQNDSKYESIINIVNPEDFVTKVMLRSWGYRRYGKTYTLPSKTNDKNYQTYLNKMRPVFKETTGKLYDPYKKGEVKTYKMVKNFGEEVSTLDDFYSETFWYSMSFKEPFIFKTPFTFFRNTLLKYLVSGDKSGIMDIILFCGPFYLGILAYFAWPDINTSEVIDAITSDKKVLDGVALGGKFEHAHLMDTYAAYIHSMTSEEVLDVVRKGYEGTVNCPVDVEIYDKETGDLVGRIVNNVVDEEIAAKENSVVMDVENDSKSFWLPSNGDYEIRLIGNDEGTMDYTMSEIDSDVGEVKRVNFFDVEIDDGLTMISDVESEDFIIEEHELLYEDGEALKPTEIFDEDIETYNIDISTLNGGSSTSSKAVRSGDYVSLTATANEGWSFIGWYENNELISVENNLVFVAKSDRNLEVRFEHIDHTYDADDETCTICGFDRTEDCGCRCHKTGIIAKLIWKFMTFFNKLLRQNQACSCGVNHY